MDGLKGKGRQGTLRDMQQTISTFKREKRRWVVFPHHLYLRSHSTAEKQQRPRWTTKGPGNPPPTFFSFFALFLPLFFVSAHSAHTQQHRTTLSTSKQRTRIPDAFKRDVFYFGFKLVEYLQRYTSKVMKHFSSILSININ